MPQRLFVGLCNIHPSLCTALYTPALNTHTHHRAYFFFTEGCSRIHRFEFFCRETQSRYRNPQWFDWNIQNWRTHTHTVYQWLIDLYHIFTLVQVNLSDDNVGRTVSHITTSTQHLPMWKWCGTPEIELAVANDWFCKKTTKLASLGARRTQS